MSAPGGSFLPRPILSPAVEGLPRDCGSRHPVFRWTPRAAVEVSDLPQRLVAEDPGWEETDVRPPALAAEETAVQKACARLQKPVVAVRRG